VRQNGLQNFILLLCLGFGGLNFASTYAQEVSKPKPVKVATPQRGKIEREITYTGSLEADAKVEIYANTPGKLVVLKVDEGNQVNKGDVLAQTDSRELHIALKQARAALKVVEAQLSTVKATAQIKVEAQAEAAQASLDAAKAQLEQARMLARAQVISQFEQATAGVTAAEANLKKTIKGARNQEIQQAKAAVSREKANLENAQANFDRVKTLHGKEAISDRDLDNAKAQLDGAKAQHDATVEQLSLVEAGVRQEDIIAAETQLHKARASLALSRVTVDTEDWNTQITIAESQVRQAESNLLTAQKLVQIGVWENDITAAQAQFDQANQQVNLAKKRLADATIIAPVSGIVANRNADLGDYITGGPGGSPIFTIVKMDVVKVVFTVPEVDLSNVLIGAPVSISTRQQQIHGNIDFISPIVNPESRAVKIKSEISNPGYQLKPGMFVEVNIDLSATDDLLLLPREVVLDIQDRVGHVFIVKEGKKARQQAVKVGLVWGEEISILEGLTDSTLVIVNGHRQLADGTEIFVVK
jgi:RND family efflux transporter MFP subunit